MSFSNPNANLSSVASIQGRPSNLTSNGSIQTKTSYRRRNNNNQSGLSTNNYTRKNIQNAKHLNANVNSSRKNFPQPIPSPTENKRKYNDRSGSITTPNSLVSVEIPSRLSSASSASSLLSVSSSDDDTVVDSLASDIKSWNPLRSNSSPTSPPLTPNNINTNSDFQFMTDTFTKSSTASTVPVVKEKQLSNRNLISEGSLNGLSPAVLSLLQSETRLSNKPATASYDNAVIRSSSINYDDSNENGNNRSSHNTTGNDIHSLLQELSSFDPEIQITTETLKLLKLDDTHITQNEIENLTKSKDILNSKITPNFKWLTENIQSIDDEDKVHNQYNEQRILQRHQLQLKQKQQYIQQRQLLINQQRQQNQLQFINSEMMSQEQMFNRQLQTFNNNSFINNNTNNYNIHSFQENIKNCNQFNSFNSSNSLNSLNYDPRNNQNCNYSLPIARDSQPAMQPAFNNFSSNSHVNSATISGPNYRHLHLTDNNNNRLTNYSNVSPLNRAAFMNNLNMIIPNGQL